MRMSNALIIDCPRCGAKVKLIDGFNICLMCALPIVEEDLKKLAETEKEEKDERG